MSDGELSKYQPDGSIEDYLSFGFHRVTPTTAKKLEAELKITPDDLLIHLRLLEYFHLKYVMGSKRQTAREPFLQQLLWLIDTHPKHIIHSHPFGFSKGADENFPVVRLHWLERVRLAPDDVVVLNHAAKYCCMHDPESAERFLKRASELDPIDDRPPYELCKIYHQMAYEAKKLDKRKFALAAIEQMNISIQRYSKTRLAHSAHTYHFEYAVQGVADLAISCKLFEEANQLAQVLMDRESIEESRGYSTYGTEEGRASMIRVSKNKGRAILAKSALAGKNIPLAEKHLKSLIEHHQDGEFEFKLANDLLQKGESATVLLYLKRVREILRTNSKGLSLRLSTLPQTNDQRWDGKLSTWISEIERGLKPRISAR